MDEIDSVPQLEALLLVWNSRPKEWTSESMGRALYVSTDVAQEILRRLAQRHLIAEVTGNSGQYVVLAESDEKEKLLASLDTVYRRELVRVSNMIHSKASRAVRDFASAFRFKKD
ncbi:MAG: hypothetical protein ACRD3N_06255 [Terracidiphilus sp.]